MLADSERQGEVTQLGSAASLGHLSKEDFVALVRLRWQNHEERRVNFLASWLVQSKPEIYLGQAKGILWPSDEIVSIQIASIK